MDVVITDKKTTGLSLGLAIYAAKKEARIARSEWNGRGMFVYVVPAHMANQFGKEYKVQESLMLKTAQDTLVPWTPSHSDVLATDWYIVTEKIVSTPGELYR